MVKQTSFVRIMQYLFYFMFHHIIKLSLRAKIIVPQSLNLNKHPIIIVANHISKIDPFLMTLLPFSIFRRLTPIRFMTAEYYYNQWLIRQIIRSLGAYPIRKWAWTLEELLRPTMTLLKNKNTVMIFPEGKIVRTKMKEKTKLGFTYIISKIDATILPIKIEGLKRKNFFQAIARGKVVIKVGNPIIINNFKRDSIDKNQSDNVMQIIHKL